MRLTKQTSHAVRILIHCARAADQLTKVADIADQLDISQQNVFKIVHLLARAGFVKAVRGRNGGVRLARAPNEIRIGEVVRTMEVMEVVLDGESSPKGGAGPNQSISRVLDDALEAFISVLDQHTLEDMAKRHPSEATDKPRRRRSPDGPRSATSAVGSNASTRRSAARPE